MDFKVGEILLINYIAEFIVSNVQGAYIAGVYIDTGDVAMLGESDMQCIQKTGKTATADMLCRVFSI